MLSAILEDSSKHCTCVECVPCTIHEFKCTDANPTGQYELLSANALLHYINPSTEAPACRDDGAHDDINILNAIDSKTSTIICNIYADDNDNSYYDSEYAALDIIKVNSATLLFMTHRCITQQISYYKLTFADAQTLDRYLAVCAQYRCNIITNIHALVSSCPLDAHIAALHLKSDETTELTAQLQKKDATIANLTDAVRTLRTEYDVLYRFCESMASVQHSPKYLEQSTIELGVDCAPPYPPTIAAEGDCAPPCPPASIAVTADTAITADTVADADTAVTAVDSVAVASTNNAAASYTYGCTIC
jgi:hypothetical protein